MSGAWPLVGVFIAMAVAGLAWAFVYWDIERRRLALDKDAQWELKSRVERFEKELQDLREVGCGTQMSLEKGLTALEGKIRKAFMEDPRLRDHEVAIAQRLEDQLATFARLSALEQSMRDLGNPKPMRAAQAARIDPFGRHK